MSRRRELTAFTPPPRAVEWLRLVLVEAMDSEEKHGRRGVRGRVEHLDFIRSSLFGHVIAAAHIAGPDAPADAKALYERLQRMQWSEASDAEDAAAKLQLIALGNRAYETGVCPCCRTAATLFARDERGQWTWCCQEGCNP